MILIIENDATEHAGILGQTLQDHGHKLHVIRTYKGDQIPTDLDLFQGLICLGGSMNASDTAEHPWLEQACQAIQTCHKANKPVIGICLGAQLIAKALGGEVSPAKQPEAGVHSLKLSFFGTTDSILIGLPWAFPMFQLHAQEVSKAPAGGTPMPLASSAACTQQIFNVGRTTYGFQGHFEWTETQMRQALNQAPDAWLDTRTRTSHESELAQTAPRLEEIGKRICETIAQRLLPMNKRVPNHGENVDNFHAHIS